MAKTHTVKSGDTLWGIAATYLGSGAKYPQIAEWNNIPNPNIIHIGQVLVVEKPSGSSSTASSSSSTGVKVTGPGLLVSDDRKLVASWTWGKESQTESYKVVWEYQALNGPWYTGSSKNITVDQDYKEGSRYDIYDIPSEAVAVRFKIKPISKTKKVKQGDKEVETVHWTQGWTGWKPNWSGFQKFPLDITPSAPSVTIDENNKLTASLSNLDEKLTHVRFEIVKDDSVSVVTSNNLAIDTSKLNDRHISYEYKVEAGHNYKVRCKVMQYGKTSDWSPFCENIHAYPAVPSSLKDPKAAGRDNGTYSVALEWSKVISATKYEIQYTTKKEYFDNHTADVTSVSTEKAVTSLIIYGLDGGTYFFRVRAINEKGESGWSEIKSIGIGEPPAAPTTWSSTTTAMVGEDITLYWVHNSKDGSRETSADIRLTVDGVSTKYSLDFDWYYRINAAGNAEKIKEKTDEEKETTSYCILDTSRFAEGAELTWEVQTAGVVNAMGAWSTPREIDIYAKPTLELTVTDTFRVNDNGSITLLPPEDGLMDTLKGFPFFLQAVAGPMNTKQTPIGYHVSITADTAYETVDELGNDKTVNAGEELYSKYFDISTVLMVEFSASNLDLENDISYTITCTVSMDSGLTATKTYSFSVSWEEVQYEPNAEITIDNSVYSAAIRPYCEDRRMVYRKVSKTNNVYSVTDEEVDIDTLDDVYTSDNDIVRVGLMGDVDSYYCTLHYTRAGVALDTPRTYLVTKDASGNYVARQQISSTTMKAAYTVSGEEVLFGKDSSGSEIYYCQYEETFLVEGVSLAVYRREFDGGFTEIASGIDNLTNTFVTDPHPALDYARYRIVATTNSTGAVCYYDLPGVPVGGKAVIIQWDEAWSSFNNWSEDPLAEPTWSGSLLSLPYNIDVSDSNSADVSQIKYVGRKRPVTYYGTQLGETSTWNVEIPKGDEETLYALRRLSIWMGDVYVREPSGSGYWANVKVSYSQKHRELKIPVTFSVTRVEGGI